MSIATDLTQVATNLNTALTTANAKITAKGGTASSTIYGLSTAIENLPSGGDDGITIKIDDVISEVELNSYYINPPYHSSSEVSSSVTLTSSVNCSIGDTVVCCFAVRDSSTNFSVSSGWTMISYSNYCSGDSYYQRLCWAYKTATSTTESITITQSSSGRIYINLVAFTPDSGQTISLVDNGYEYNSSSSGSSITATKHSGLTIWGATTPYYTTSSPYGDWTVSNDSYKISLDQSQTQVRLLTALDSSNDSSVTFTVPHSNGYLIVGSLTITGITELTEEVEL